MIWQGAYDAWRRQRLDESLGLLQQAIELTESIPSWPAGPSTVRRLGRVVGRHILTVLARESAGQMLRDVLELTPR